MTWLFQPLFKLLARSTDSELAKQIEFLKAENSMLRKRLGVVAYFKWLNVERSPLNL